MADTLTDDNSSNLPSSQTQATVAALLASQESTAGTTYENLLRNYSSFSPVLSLMVTNPTNYNKMVSDEKFYPENWDTICKTGGVGSSKAKGFSGGTTEYFISDLYIDSVTVNTIVGMSQETRGTNAIDLDISIIEPNGMDFIEQLSDYCTYALQEHNYCQLPYMLKIDFKGFKDDGTNETVSGATKYIPIQLQNMSVKVNNLGANYQLSAIAYNELGYTERYGRIPANIQIGSESGIASSISTSVTDTGDVSAVAQTATQNDSSTTIADVNTGGKLSAIVKALEQTINKVQSFLVSDHKISVADQYSINFVTISDKTGNINIGDYAFLDTATLSQDDTLPVPKNITMGTPSAADNSYSPTIAGQNMLKYVTDPSTGETQNGAVTYTNAHLLTFNAGSSITDCLNTLIINSDYIVSQISSYNKTVSDICKTVQSLNIQAGATIPDSLQTKLDTLKNTPLNWFKITSSQQIGSYDGGQNCYSRNITYNIIPYKIYNSRSISVPNGNPSSDGRVVKKYDYIFTGKNTEVLNFELEYNMAFLTYAQFNHDTKIQSTGGDTPANSDTTAPLPALKTVPSAITAGQSKTWASSSQKIPFGAGEISPERNQAADVASTIYTPADQISISLGIMGDPDYIQQDGVFINPTDSNAFRTESASSSIRGIMFNSGEVYANVNFKIPQDININTGVLDLAFKGDSANYHRNIFSGMYRIQTVNSKFDKGQFTQQLNMYRMDDSHNFTVNTKTTSSQSS
ncbi:Uncharacterised protein [uncultured archaeon]|nr:Uncharacterised protein [uncultured archaeon]